MKKTVLVLLAVSLLITGNLYAGSGDMTVKGKLGVGTTATPGATLDIRGNAVFNEDGANNDFRVEGDNDSNLLFIDASRDKVGIGTNSPEAKIDVRVDNPTDFLFNGSEGLAVTTRYGYTDAFARALAGIMEVNDSVTVTMPRMGLNAFVYHTSNNDVSGGMIGGNYAVRFQNYSGGNITGSVIGVASSIQGLDATPADVITSSYSFYSYGANPRGTMNITNAYGIKVDRHTTQDSAAITNAYGLVLDKQISGSGINRAIWLAADDDGDGGAAIWFGETGDSSVGWHGTDNKLDISTDTRFGGDVSFVNATDGLILKDTSSGRDFIITGDPPQNDDTGISVIQTSTSPFSAEAPIFRVMSPYGTVRLGVEHFGETYMHENDFAVYSDAGVTRKFFVDVDTAVDIPANNFPLRLGAGQNVEMYYDGADLIVNTDASGTGSAKINGLEIDKDGFIRPKSSADASAPSNSIYYSTTQGRLVYKDYSSVVNNLY